jgi:hypothetical protein
MTGFTDEEIAAELKSRAAAIKLNKARREAERREAEKASAKLQHTLLDL